MAIVDDVQARLDSYTSNKQRKSRLKELYNMSKSTGYVDLEFAIEAGALMFRLQSHKAITAREVSDDMKRRAGTGEMPLHVDRNGKHERIPPEVFARLRN
jgi:hypothetical protein